MTHLPFDKYQIKGPLADGGFKVSFDLPETVHKELAELMAQEATGYIIVMNEREYEVVKKEEGR